MTTLPNVASGAESAPVASNSTPHTQQQAAAFQLFAAAMASLTQGESFVLPLHLNSVLTLAPAPPVAGGAPAAVAVPAAVDNAPAVSGNAAVAQPFVGATAAPQPAPQLVTVPSPTGFQTTGPWIAGALYVVVPGGPLLPVAEPEYTGDDAPLWYCITKGMFVGVTLSQGLASTATTGVRASAMKSYKTQIGALDAFNEMLRYGMVAVRT
ncbi:hypothetical protein C8R43DRAFT_1140771 [Mycena crocata]|nr:hypothetical protein C8R43DRAFT_1140771 [Mycena crocata]